MYIGSRKEISVKEQELSLFISLLIQQPQDFAMLIEDLEPLVRVLLSDMEPVRQPDKSRICQSFSTAEALEVRCLKAGYVVSRSLTELFKISPSHLLHQS